MDNPNVLLISVDALRPDRLGCYGNPRQLTPNIDKLASKGLRFTQAITGGSWTQAAFPVLLTSTYASMYGGCQGPLSAERPSPIDSLALSGYDTAGFSPSPLLSNAYSYNRGFRFFSTPIPNEVDPQIRKIKGGQRLLRSSIFHRFTSLMGISLRPARLYVSADELTEGVGNWLKTARRPFFAWVHYMDVHWPYYIEEELKSPEEIAQAWRDLSHLYAAGWKGASISNSQKEHYISLYEKAICFTDTCIGKLVDYLAAMGVADRTIIILVSDHGEEFLEHGRWGHWESNLFDEILHVPLIIHLPDDTRNQVINQQVRTLDIMPTILDLCNINNREGMLGTSLLTFQKENGNHSIPNFSISEMPRDEWHRVAVRNEKYKYIWDSRNPDKPQLFDLYMDPGEKHDIYANNPDVAQHLHEYIQEVLRLKETTAPEEKVLAPELSKEVLDRLRDLGYLE